MMDFLQSTKVQAVLMTALLAIMIVVGFYVVRRFRDFDGDDSPTANDLMTNFQDLRDRGDISEEEYRKLKTALGGKPQRKISSDDGETG